MLQTREKRLLNSVIAVLAMAMILTGCSKGEQSADAVGATSSVSQDSGSATAKAKYLDNSRGREIGAPLHTAAREPGAERAVIREASLSVEVANLEKAEKDMKKAITAGGGYIDREVGEDLASEMPRMQLTIRIPEKGFEDAISAFEALGKRVQKSIASSDLTEQILSNEAQLQQLKRDQAALTKGGKNVPLNGGFDSLKDRISSLQQQKDILMGQASMSTIELTLQQKANADLATAANAGWGGDTWNAAVSSAMGAFRVIGAAAIWLLVYSPIWGGLLVLSLFGYRGWKRASHKPQVA